MFSALPAIILSLPLLLLSFRPALAACQLPASAAGLGTATSFAVNGNVINSSGAISVNCGSGGTLSLLNGNYVKIQLVGATNVSAARAVLKHDSGGDAVPVRLCADANCAGELLVNGATQTYDYRQLANLIGLLGGLNFSIPVYLSTVPGQVVAAGAYTVTLNILVSYAICTGIGAAGQCLPGSLQSGSTVVPLSLSLTITNDCTTIAAPDIRFGSAPLISVFSAVSQSITVICTKNSAYSVGLNNGRNALNNVRNMSNGSALISYDIFKSNGVDRWGDSGDGRWQSGGATSVNSDGTQRTFRYEARILPNQVTPPPGDYTDSLVVDLSF
ncbi:Csu type fimbrial protein [Martelella alba]|uniref:Spore coat U domain-containing protein n=1 Tax=Martelella alba TaxID=2590451 RepID=A0ABY2SSQ0_9HYPH|nr:spore coat U domain-containing protein [Martelella alba]TKI07247.1 spore coat U domain-containing protein [Martelella alba]